MNAQPQNKNYPVILIAGPTATGKTAVAVEVCKALNGEMISADSMQVYKELCIGTAKPTTDELQGCKCHLIDILAPDKEFSVSHFVDLADKAMHEIHKAGHRIVVVGGTGLYLKGLLYGIFDEPVRDDKIRQKLRDRMKETGPEFLHAELSQVDPVSAARISVTDRHRIERALEVYQVTGKPISTFQNEWNELKPRFPFSLFVLNLPRQELYDRINARVDQMFERGWIDEVQELMKRWPGENLHCFKSIGYREIVYYLKGDLQKEELIEVIKKKTRNFAKRQLTWFRKMKGVQWLSMNDCNAAEVADKIIVSVSNRN